MAGGEADAAIAQQDGGNTVPRGGYQALAPGHLCIVMGVDVDETGRYQLFAGVNFFKATRDAAADGADHSVLDADVGLIRVAAAAINDGAAANHQVRGGGVHHDAFPSCIGSSEATRLRGDGQAAGPPLEREHDPSLSLMRRSRSRGAG